MAVWRDGAFWIWRGQRGQLSQTNKEEWMAHPGDLREAWDRLVAFFYSKNKAGEAVVDQYGDREEHDGGEAAEGGVGEENLILCLSNRKIRTFWMSGYQY